MGGIAAAQTGLSVVSNNIANLNTVGFKESNVTFQDIFSTTLTAGNSPTVTTGGKNPVQIGLGVQVGSINKNMNAGTWTSTGRTTDMMIQGNGFFSVRSSDGEVYLTKAGNFTFDANGDLVTPQGFKAIGADELFSATSANSTVNVPQKIVTDVTANDGMYNKLLSQLNDCQLTSGTFIVKVTDDTGTTTPVTVTLDTTDTNSDTMEEIATVIKAQLDARGTTATTAATAAGTQITAANASKTAATDAYNTGRDMTVALRDTIVNNADAAIADADTALAAGNMTQAQRDAIYNAATAAKAAAEAARTAGAGNMTEAQRDAITAAEDIIISNETAVQTTQTNIAQAMTGTDVVCDATTGGTIKFNVDTAQVNSLEFEAGTSNFVGQTQMRADGAGVYTSKILDYDVAITPVNSLSNAVSVSNYSIAEDGTIEATYSNGDKLTVELNQNDNTYAFKYTTSSGVIIRGDDVDVNPNVGAPSNMVIQLANVINPNGLVSAGGNLYTTGANSGDIMFTVGGTMGVGAIKSGGLEASNVDISKQFSDMILSQRAVQANSRVFSTASNIMETLVTLGR
jgi:flagellar hook protein FlgE